MHKYQANKATFTIYPALAVYCGSDRLARQIIATCDINHLLSWRITLLHYSCGTIADH
eukprot:m.129098 g.129098  ORF g.129098 m.129098 type:complete len:58 (-) comp13884_c0_seq5:1667-1840(-)